MRKKVHQLLFILHLLLVSAIAYAQAPAQFNFQGVARNSKGAVIVAKPIALRFSILTGSTTGSINYQESRSVLTDSNGVFNAIIGGGGARNITGHLDTMRWDTGPKFLQVEIDTADGIDFVNLGATQMLSVPYALYSTSSGSYFFEAVFLNSAGLSSSGGTIVFPRTNYNNLNPFTNKPVYDSTTGVFTAPVAGIYEFNVWLVTGENNNGEELDDIFLTKNGIKTKFLIEVFDVSNNGSTFPYFQLHCTILLKGNDTIRIEHGDGGLIADQSTFSGYKIY